MSESSPRRGKAPIDLGDRLERCYTGAIHDVLRDLGHRNCVLPPGIAALAPGTRLAGEVSTLAGRIDTSRTAHETLLAWTGFLAKARPHTVVLCQPNNHEIALMGELSAETLQQRGVKGYIVDGGCRDIDFLLELGFPVFARFATPADIVARWMVTAIDDPIEIGGVTIRAGDYVLGDRDGIVILPRELADEAVARAEAVVDTESEMRRAIRDGMDPQEAYRKFGIF
jgi:regulator of RNase E activity RraA